MVVKCMQQETSILIQCLGGRFGLTVANALPCAGGARADSGLDLQKSRRKRCRACRRLQRGVHPTSAWGPCRRLWRRMECADRLLAHLLAVWLATDSIRRWSLTVAFVSRESLQKASQPWARFRLSRILLADVIFHGGGGALCIRLACSEKEIALYARLRSCPVYPRRLPTGSLADANSGAIFRIYRGGAASRVKLSIDTQNCPPSRQSLLRHPHARSVPSTSRQSGVQAEPTIRRERALQNSSHLQRRRTGLSLFFRVPIFAFRIGRFSTFSIPKRSFHAFEILLFSYYYYSSLEASLFNSASANSVAAHPSGYPSSNVHNQHTPVRGGGGLDQQIRDFGLQLLSKPLLARGYALICQQRQRTTCTP